MRYHADVAACVVCNPRSATTVPSLFQLACTVFSLIVMLVGNRHVEANACGKSLHPKCMKVLRCCFSRVGCLPWRNVAFQDASWLELMWFLCVCSTGVSITVRVEGDYVIRGDG